MIRISTYKLHPNAARVAVTLSIVCGLLGMFSYNLGLNDGFKHLVLTLSALCISAFVLPNLKIWQKVTVE